MLNMLKHSFQICIWKLEFWFDFVSSVPVFSSKPINCNLNTFSSFVQVDLHAIIYWVLSSRKTLFLITANFVSLTWPKRLKCSPCRESRKSMFVGIEILFLLSANTLFTSSESSSFPWSLWVSFCVLEYFFQLS